jgi:hypothetical protein
VRRQQGHCRPCVAEIRNPRSLVAPPRPGVMNLFRSGLV